MASTEPALPLAHAALDAAFGRPSRTNLLQVDWFYTPAAPAGQTVLFDRAPSVQPDHGDAVPVGQVPIETADRFAALLATIR